MGILFADQDVDVLTTCLADIMGESYGRSSEEVGIQFDSSLEGCKCMHQMMLLCGPSF